MIKIVKCVNEYYSLIYSTHKQIKTNFSEVIGMPKINENYPLLFNSFKDAEDITEIFHGRKDAKIKA